MKYIRIKNNGLIEPQALHLVGASTKQGDESKIGQFGSGNKYALAYLLRNGYEVKIFAGMTGIVIETKAETFRDQTFDVMWINGEKTSITIQMGKDWQLWQALREIYCNAIDEGGCSIDFVQDIKPVPGETHFYIDTKKDVMDFITNFDTYFSIRKKVLFECSEGRIYEKTGTAANIYRKGIRCWNTNTKSIYDYDFNEIEIDEDRLIKYAFQIDEKMWSLIFQCHDEEIILNVLHQCSNTEYIEAGITEYWSVNSGLMSETFKNCLRKINLAPKGYAGLLKPDEVFNHVILPTKIFNSVRSVLSDDNVGDRFKVSRHGGMFREVEPTTVWQKTLDEAIYFLKEVKLVIPYDISVALFEVKSVLGCATNGQIYISDVCLEKGVNETVNTLIEEYIHLKYAVSDETRGFQTAIITEFISYMKSQNAIII